MLDNRDTRMYTQSHGGSAMKKECALKGCIKKFTPRTNEHRFCSSKHKDLWHARDRQRIMVMVRKLGVGR